MRHLRLLIPFVLVAFLVSACSSGGISASNCDEIVDETMELFQRLIDDVDAEFEDMTVTEFMATEGDLPSLSRFEEDAQTIDDLAAELGCTQTQISEDVIARSGELTAETDLGRFIIDALRVGGI